MTLQKMARLSLTCVMILSVLAACAPDTPTPEATVTLVPTLFFTETPNLPPTETVAPTGTLDPAAVTVTVDAGAANTTAGTAAAPTAASVNPPAGGKAPDRYEYLGQDVPDRTQFLPSRQVTITWTVKNAGTNGWTKDYTLRYFSGPKPLKDVYSFTKDVPAGATINFVVTFTTPAEPGDYDLWFKLTNLQNQNFGDLDLVFTVSNNPVKATKAPVTPATAAP